MRITQFVTKSSAIGLLAVCFFLFSLFFARLDIDPEAADILKRWVSAEYTRYQVSREDLSLLEKAELLKYAEHIEFLEIEARGKPERMIFRVEIASNPAKPPTSPSVQYFRMEHSLLLGWHGSVPKFSSALVFFLALFMV